MRNEEGGRRKKEGGRRNEDGTVVRYLMLMAHACMHA